MTLSSPEHKCEPPPLIPWPHSPGPGIKIFPDPISHPSHFLSLSSCYTSAHTPWEPLCSWPFYFLPFLPFLTSLPSVCTVHLPNPQLLGPLSAFLPHTRKPAVLNRGDSVLHSPFLGHRTLVLV